MKKIKVAVIVLALLMLTGCASPITSEEIKTPVDTGESSEQFFSADISEGEDDIYVGGKYSDKNQIQFLSNAEITEKDRVFFSLNGYMNAVCFVDNASDDVRLSCLDPTCTHETKDCLLYMLDGRSLYYTGGYMFAQRGHWEDGRTRVFKIDVDTLEKTEIYNSGGQVSSRMFGMGRFLYIVENVVDENDAGKTIHRYIRYDIETDTAVALTTDEFGWTIGTPTPHNGRLYYLDTYNNVHSVDVRLKDHRVETEEKGIKTFDLEGDYLYYTASDIYVAYGDEDALYSANYVLKRKNIITEVTENVMDDVVYFNINDGEIAYTYIDPVPVGPYSDFEVDEETGREYYREVVLDSDVGNKTYIAKLGKDGISDIRTVAPPEGSYFNGVDASFIVGDYFYSRVTRLYQYGGLNCIEFILMRTPKDDPGEWLILDDVGADAVGLIRGNREEIEE